MRSSRLKITILVGAVALVIGRSALASQPFVFAPSDRVYSVQEAVRQGLVRAEIKPVGSAFGTVLLLTLQRQVSYPVHVAVAPGTIFLNNAGRQDMVAAGIVGEATGPTTYIRTGSVAGLHDGAPHTFVVEGFCADFELDAPEKGDSFRIAMLKEEDARVIEIGKQRDASLAAIQGAIWLRRNPGLSASRLMNRIKITAEEVAEAQRIAEVARRYNEAAIYADVGEFVKAAKDMVPLMLGDRIIAVLRKGTRMEVTAVRGEWFGVEVILGGEPVRGWVKRVWVEKTYSPVIIGPEV